MQHQADILHQPVGKQADGRGDVCRGHDDRAGALARIPRHGEGGVVSGIEGADRLFQARRFLPPQPHAQLFGHGGDDAGVQIFRAEGEPHPLPDAPRRQRRDIGAAAADLRREYGAFVVRLQPLPEGGEHGRFGKAGDADAAFFRHAAEAGERLVGSAAMHGKQRLHAVAAAGRDADLAQKVREHGGGRLFVGDLPFQDGADDGEQLAAARKQALRLAADGEHAARARGEHEAAGFRQHDAAAGEIDLCERSAEVDGKMHHPITPNAASCARSSSSGRPTMLV